jgi:peptidoglycan/LPS O-acetylase OafA/YrhL
MYIPSVGGAMLAYEKKNSFSEGKAAIIFGVVCTILGMLLGGFPSASWPTGIYSFLGMSDPDMIHGFAAIIFIFGMMCWPPKFLNNQRVGSLGKYSYAFYLIHCQFLFSGTQFLFTCFYPRMGYNIAALLSAVISIIVLMLLSVLFTKTVVSGTRKIVARTINGIYEIAD